MRDSREGRIGIFWKLLDVAVRAAPALGMYRTYEVSINDDMDGL